jgi:hypothetical protein
MRSCALRWQHQASYWVGQDWLIQLQDGIAVRSLGLFVRADRQLTTYYMIACEGLDRALSLAERILDYHVTAVEVRPVHDLVDMTLN